MKTLQSVQVDMTKNNRQLPLTKISLGSTQRESYSIFEGTLSINPQYTMDFALPRATHLVVTHMRGISIVAAQDCISTGTFLMYCCSLMEF